MEELAGGSAGLRGSGGADGTESAKISDRWYIGGVSCSSEESGSSGWGMWHVCVPKRSCQDSAVKSGRSAMVEETVLKESSKITFHWGDINPVAGLSTSGALIE